MKNVRMYRFETETSKKNSTIGKFKSWTFLFVLKLTFKLFVVAVAHRKSCYAPKIHFSFVLVELLKCKNSALKKRKNREVSRFI